MTDTREQELARLEARCELLRCPDGRVFICVGGHYIPRRFIWRVKVEYSGYGHECLFVEGVGGRIDLAELPGTPENVGRLKAMADRIIELWIEP